MEHLSRRASATGAPPRTALTALSLWIAAALAAMLGIALGARATALAGQVGRARVDALVELGVLTAGVAVLAWLLLSCVVAAGCLTARAAGLGWRRGERWVHRWAPSAVRRAMVLAVGAGIGISAATGAAAGDVVPSGSPSPSLGVVAVPRAEVDLGWVPTGDAATSPPAGGATSAPTVAASSAPGGAAAVSGAPESAGAPAAAARTSDASPSPLRPAVATSTATQGAPREAAGDPVSATTGTERRPSGPSPAREAAAASTTRTVTVAPGDTLWAIAARHLPPGVGDTAVAAAWPAWYAANLATIGGDPGLIRPGQVLTVPAEPGAASRAGAAS